MCNVFLCFTSSVKVLFIADINFNFSVVALIRFEHNSSMTGLVRHSCGVSVKVNGFEYKYDLNWNIMYISNLILLWQNVCLIFYFFKICNLHASL